VVALRSFIVWVVIMLAEVLHGTLRVLLLQPLTGDFRARQVSVFTGSLMILGIVILFIRWIAAKTVWQLIGVGVLWLALTILFEVLFGLFVIGDTWERLASDYNLLEGGLMPLGLLFFALSPLVATKLRR
jgi:hypothetical protein